MKLPSFRSCYLASSDVLLVSFHLENQRLEVTSVISAHICVHPAEERRSGSSCLSLGFVLLSLVCCVLPCCGGQDASGSAVCARLELRARWLEVYPH